MQATPLSVSDRPRWPGPPQPSRQFAREFMSPGNNSGNAPSRTLRGANRPNTGLFRGRALQGICVSERSWQTASLIAGGKG